MQKQELRARKLTDFVKAEATALGFDLFRITSPDAIPLAPERLREFLDSGFHGTHGLGGRETQERAGLPQDPVG